MLASFLEIEAIQKEQAEWAGGMLVGVFSKRCNENAAHREMRVCREHMAGNGTSVMQPSIESTFFF